MKKLAITFCILNLAFCILGAQTKTRVQDALFLADGTKAAGSLNIAWPAFVTSDGFTVAKSSLNVKIVSGNVSVDLFPTVGTTPTGVSYTVTYSLSNSPSYTEFWLVPATGPVTIGQVRISPMPIPTTTFGEQQLTLGTGLQTLLGLWKRDSSPVPTAEGQCYWDGLAHAIMCTDASLDFQPLAGTPDATVSIKGKLKLAGDLSGTADAPTVPNMVRLSGDQSVAGNKTFSDSLAVGSSATGAKLSVQDSGTKTATTYGAYVANNALSSSAADKYGMYVSSTGAWSGTGANNFGLYIAPASGAANNWDAWIGSPASSYTGVIQEWDMAHAGKSTVSQVNSASDYPLVVLAQSNSTTKPIGGLAVIAEPTNATTNTAPGDVLSPLNVLGILSGSGDLPSLTMNSTYAEHLGTGAVTNFRNVYSSAAFGRYGANPDSGNVANYWGFLHTFDFSTNSTLGEAHGLSIYGPTTYGGTGTINNLYGVRVLDQGVSFATNKYALKIEDQTGATAYAIKTGTGKVEFGDSVAAPRINAVRYADQFAGADAGAKIAAALADLPAGGGTVDARGLEGGTIATDIFTTVIKPVVLEWGAGTFSFSLDTAIPANITLKLGQGAILCPAAAKTLTINGPLVADASQHFCGTGTVAIAADSSIYLNSWFPAGSVHYAIGTTNVDTASPYSGVLGPSKWLTEDHATAAVLSSANKFFSGHRIDFFGDAGGSYNRLQPAYLSAQPSVITKTQGQSYNFGGSVLSLGVGNGGFASAKAECFGSAGPAIVTPGGIPSCGGGEKNFTQGSAVTGRSTFSALFSSITAAVPPVMTYSSPVNENNATEPWTWTQGEREIYNLRITDTGMVTGTGTGDQFVFAGAPTFSDTYGTAACDGHIAGQTCNPVGQSVKLYITTAGKVGDFYTPSSLGVLGGYTTINSGGTGYVVGDVVTVSGGSACGTLTITSVNGGGAVTGFSVTYPCLGYVVGTNIATTGGAGAGFTVNLNQLGCFPPDVRMGPVAAPDNVCIATKYKIIKVVNATTLQLEGFYDLDSGNLPNPNAGALNYTMVQGRRVIGTANTASHQLTLGVGLATWQASAAYTAGDNVEPTTPNGFYYRAGGAGTTAGTEPSWPTTPGNTVVDGGVTWTCTKLLYNWTAGDTLYQPPSPWVLIQGQFQTTEQRYPLASGSARASVAYGNSSIGGAPLSYWGWGKGAGGYKTGLGFDGFTTGRVGVDLSQVPWSRAAISLGQGATDSRICWGWNGTICPASLFYDGTITLTGNPSASVKITDTAGNSSWSFLHPALGVLELRNGANAPILSSAGPAVTIGNSAGVSAPGIITQTVNQVGRFGGFTSYGNTGNGTGGNAVITGYSSTYPAALGATGTNGITFLTANAYFSGGSTDTMKRGSNGFSSGELGIDMVNGKFFYAYAAAAGADDSAITWTYPLQVDGATGGTTLASLVGTGSRLVQADANGTLSASTSTTAVELTANKNQASGYAGLSAGGLLSAAQLPLPSASTLGGVKALTCTGTDKLSAIGTDGLPVCGVDQEGVTGVSGTPNEVASSGGATPVISLPSALTFTGKTVTGGLFTATQLSPWGSFTFNSPGAPNIDFLKFTNTNSVAADINSNVIRIDVAAPADTTSGLKIGNTGHSDNMTLWVGGTTSGVTTPTGLGIIINSLNEDGSGGERNAGSGTTNSRHIGINSGNESIATNSNPVHFNANNATVGNRSPVLWGRTDGNAVIAQPKSFSADTTSTTTISAGSSQVATPASMNNIEIGSFLLVDTGAAQEFVRVTAATGTTFTAHFQNAHGPAAWDVVIANPMIRVTGNGWTAEPDDMQADEFLATKRGLVFAQRFETPMADPATDVAGFYGRDSTGVAYPILRLDSGGYTSLLSPATGIRVLNKGGTAQLFEITNAGVINGKDGNLSISAGGAITSASLAGTGTRYVKASDAGLLSAGTIGAADLPLPTASTIGAIKSLTCSGTDKLSAIGTDGLPVCSADVSGGGAAWGSITGTLSSQTDLQSALDARFVRATANTLTNASAPSTPAAGSTAVWTDTIDKTLKAKDDAGVVTTTVKPDAGASNNFLTAVSAAGVISKAQPAFSDLSGSIASGQQNNPAVGAKGGVEAKTCTGSDKLSAIGTDGVPVCSADQGTLVASGTSGTGPAYVGDDATAARSDHDHRSIHTLTWHFAGTPATGVQNITLVLPEGIVNPAITDVRVTVNTTSAGSSTFNIQRCTAGCTGTSPTFADIYSSVLTLSANTRTTSKTSAPDQNVSGLAEGDQFKASLVNIGASLADITVTMTVKYNTTN